MAPGRAAELSIFGGPVTRQDQLTDPGVREVLVKEPLATFPASMAVARVQAPGYRNYCIGSYGSGRYSVVTTHDVETPADFERLQKLPMVRSVSPVSRLLLPDKLDTSDELRRAGAAVGADIMLVYTFDTVYKSDDLAPPIKILTLGLFPTYSIKVNTTASAVLLDVRNGYVYGCAEASSKRSTIGNAWTDEAAADGARKRAEREALDGLLGNLEKAWGQVVMNNVSRPAIERREVIVVPRQEWWNEWRVQGPQPVPEGKRYRTVP
jgi:hypothetical protein